MNQKNKRRGAQFFVEYESFAFLGITKQITIGGYG